MKKKPMDIGVITSNGRVLDGITGVIHAFSVRKLRTAYTGNCMRLTVGSSGDNHDIGFDSAGNVDETTLNGKLSLGALSLRVWYNQAGNINLANSSAATQPLVSNAGTLVKVNNRISTLYSGSRRISSGSYASGGQTFALGKCTLIAVVKEPSATNALYVGHGSESQTTLSTYLMGAGAPPARAGGVDTGVNVQCANNANWIGTNFSIVALRLSDADLRYYKNNNTPIATQTFTHSPPVNNRTSGIWLNGSNAVSFAGNISEVILFNRDITEKELKLIIDNQKSYFGI